MDGLIDSFLFDFIFCVDNDCGVNHRVESSRVPVLYYTRTFVVRVVPPPSSAELVSSSPSSPTSLSSRSTVEKTHRVRSGHEETTTTTSVLPSWCSSVLVGAWSRVSLPSAVLAGTSPSTELVLVTVDDRLVVRCLVDNGEPPSP
uniref:Uncharacterized protein n=1 Tax=Pseudo-nitzschia australis TaxID=44445 RepID=A0A7S4AS38_9STRA|mmetsp:Transcript_2565/g.5577  ORF Transcript_2565/g.5577 Transcript_2565/m.5577 type:complete len:145 (+) Transcript_2565:202-636(+)